MTPHSQFSSYLPQEWYSPLITPLLFTHPVLASSMELSPAGDWWGRYLWTWASRPLEAISSNCLKSMTSWVPSPTHLFPVSPSGLGTDWKGNRKGVRPTFQSVNRSVACAISYFFSFFSFRFLYIFLPLLPAFACDNFILCLDQSLGFLSPLLKDKTFILFINIVNYYCFRCVTSRVSGSNTLQFYITLPKNSSSILSMMTDIAWVHSLKMCEASIMKQAIPDIRNIA